MSRKRLLFVGAFIFIILLIAGCAGPQGPEGPVGPAGATGPLGPAGPPGVDATASQEYVGSEKCGECHESQYATFVQSGHPYKLNKVENGQPPVYPHDDITGGITEPPEGYTWDDISYVIGGFGWKARFIDQNGYIITGDADATTQYNFANEEVGAPAGWVAYHAGEELPYDCGSCHTTGYSPQGHQDGMEGIIGTWAEPGIQCEACHGPGSRHIENPQGVQMVLDRSSQLCGSCHVRGNPAEIDASDGFERHHEQYEDLYNSKHFAISCITCHDPHASTLYEDSELNPNKGINQTCTACHWQQEAIQKSRFHQRLGVVCTDCHMPPMAKSAQANLETFTGDVSSHQFSINPDPAAPQFNEEGTVVMPYLTLSYACQHCHNGELYSEQDLEELSEMATGYHDAPTPTPIPQPTATPEPTPEPTEEPTATPEG
jgi:hypothetical protein